MADGSVPIDETFVLELSSGVQSELLQGEMRPGFHINTYRLADGDKARMQAADDKLKVLKAESTGGNDLTFQASVQTSLAPDMPPPDNFSLTMYLRTHSAVDFVALGPEQIIDRDNPNAGHIFEPEGGGPALS